jgi:hypothetical protein
MTRTALNLLLLFLLTASFSFEGTFEGKVVYRNSYKSNMPNVTDQQFTSMMGNTQEYFIKGGNYKSVNNGALSQWQLYVNKDNKFYNKMSNSQAVYWNDAAVHGDKVIKAEVNKGVINILGYACDELILTCTSGTEKYYFSPRLKLDAKAFAQHKLGNWSEYVSRAQAIPLKMVIEKAQFSLEAVAVEVTPMKLDDSQFELPANSKLEKSPY